METITQRRVPASAGSIGKPAGASSSVFDMGRQARPPRKPRERIDFDVDSVAIRKNVPPPPLVPGRTSKYRELLVRMKAGESVVVPMRVGYGIKSAAKKAEIKVTVRTIGDGTMGVWKL